MTYVVKDKQSRASSIDARDDTGRRSVAVAVIVMLWLLVTAIPAEAGPPHHQRIPSLDIAGFNHACGVIVDSHGDVYVSDPGNSQIKVYDQGHVELASISDTNEPCGLAMDSKGHLYVSDTATGNVVRYTPNAFPFSGPLTYGAPTAIDSSSSAKGISVDPSDDRLYVAEGNQISSYSAEGTLGIDEIQRVLCLGCTSGTFTLSFNGQETSPLAWDATHAEVQAGLEALPSVGAGNISVSQATFGFGPEDHLVGFHKNLGAADVPLLTADVSGLSGEVVIEEKTKGFNGIIGDGDLSDATGVAAYTSPSGDRYVFAADNATNAVKTFSGTNVRSLQISRTINGPTPSEDFDFGPTTYLSVDPGNDQGSTGKCLTINEQACTAGHLLVYDDGHSLIDEFEATGVFLDDFTDPLLSKAESTAMAIDRSGGVNDGTIFATTDAAKLLAFGSLPTPSRSPLTQLSHELATAQAVATDPMGFVYAAAGSVIHVFRPDGQELAVGPEGKGISTAEPAHDIAVDATGKVYMLGKTNTGNPGQEKVQYFTPTSFPPQDGTQFNGPTVVATGNSFPKPPGFVTAIGIDPVKNSTFITSYSGQIVELGSAAEGSPILDHCFACALAVPRVEDIAVNGKTGEIYLPGASGTILIVNSTGTEVLSRITGGGSPRGAFGSVSPGSIAVDETNGHILLFNNARGTAEEYDESGSFVAEFGTFTENILRGYAIAVDNSCSLHIPPLSQATNPACNIFDSANGNVYVAFDDATGPEDVFAFSPLAYGEPPIAAATTPDGIGGGSATLRGTIDPRGFQLEDCYFEYLTDDHFLENGRTFAGSDTAPCVEETAEIGHGTGPVSVHAAINGLDADTRYRFRLLGHNKYGAAESAPGLFGPPLVVLQDAQPVLYSEAVVRALIDPSGLETQYRFEYGRTDTYDLATPWKSLPPSDGSTPVQATLINLSEGSEYHFRLTAKNEASEVSTEDRVLETSERLRGPSCANTGFRTGLSANLPDCRAYEIVTPAGASPGTTIPGTAGQIFNNWFVAPRGEGAGNSLAYFSGTLPGVEGTGGTDGYRADRAAGSHPVDGWGSELFGPSFALAGGGGANQHGIAADQSNWFWEIHNPEGLAGALPAGNYLRIAGTPSSACSPQPESHFEVVGCGSLGTDLSAEGRFASPGGSHVIFFSNAQLEPAAAPAGTMSIYDRSTGASNATVLSVKPDGTSFAASEAATYVATTEDGSATLFKVNGVLYLHRQSHTTEVAAAPNAFAGISEDGSRIFYTDHADGEEPGNIWMCDVESGPCAGPDSHPATLIASKAVFVNVSADGSHVFFTSEDQAGAHNLHVWTNTGNTFIAILADQDFESFEGRTQENLLRWTSAITAGSDIGRGNSPTRSSPNGSVFVFQSHAQLTSYDNHGRGEIYRYAETPSDQLICISCAQTDVSAGGDAQLQVLNSGGVTEPTTLIPNVTDDGQRIIFQSADRLIPEDANDTQDVYEWEGQNAGGCTRRHGCLALISSGQGERPSYLFSMTANGHDIFFETGEKLVASDDTGTPSLYDAREDGGIPDPPSAEPCIGDACKSAQTPPPSLQVAGDETHSASTATPPRRICPKGKHKVKGRCVRKHPSKRHNRRRHNSTRRAAS